jgi:hypothetical protein
MSLLPEIEAELMKAAQECSYDALHYTGAPGEHIYARCPECNNYLAVVIHRKGDAMPLGYDAEGHMSGGPKPISREEAQDMIDAHDEGYHTPPDGVPREGCPECEGRELSDYPPAA